MSDLLLASQLSYRLPQTSQALFEGLTLTLAAGERLGLQGPSGCGKTTLLRCLVGLDDPSDGEIVWSGEQVGPLTVSALRRRVVYVRQQAVGLGSSLAEDLTLLEAYRGSPLAVDAAQRERLLKTLGLQDIPLTRSFNELSIGEQQRFALFRALLLKPDVLLLDEPTSALDADRAEVIEGLLMAFLNEQSGRAWIWVSHDRAQLERVCSRIVQWPKGGQPND